MKKLLTIVAFAIAVLPMAAQETYENAKIISEDLNGTARYVGMGGAMEALGADISTIGTNPAGIGLFRRSNISLSVGLVSQQDVDNVLGANKTNVSFDQAGFVWASRSDRSSFINVAFNFHKSRNFDFILSAANGLDNASLNKLTFAKARATAVGHDEGVGGLLYEQKSGEPTSVEKDGEYELNYVPDFRYPYITCNQLDEIYSRIPDFVYGGGSLWNYYNAQSFDFNRSHEGYIGEYDINLSGNINDRVYLGFTVGIHDVHYKHYSEYREAYADNNFITTVDNREITGMGYSVKLGAIFRPVEESPFRFGVSVSSPTFYKLTTSNYTYVTDDRLSFDNKGINDSRDRSNYKFKLHTPWKFGASLGHTIGEQVALGLSYEYADYGTIDSRYITDEYYYDYYTDSYSDRSASDRVMNQHSKRTLKGVHTIKVGGEFRPVPEMAVRLGYNYVSPMYDKEGFKDGTLDSDASYVSSATDYTNWEDTHRITCGFGYTFDKFNVSLAYQYSITNGKFSPFMGYTDNDIADFDNNAPLTKVSNKRHQLLCTLSYSF